MIINYNSTTLEIQPEDSSYRYREVMGENTLTLYFKYAGYINLPVGAYVQYQGQTYTLTKPSNFIKKGTRIFDYTLILDSPQANLKKYKYKAADGSLKFPLTAKPLTHLQLLVSNMNARESGWSVGSYIDAPEKLVTYNHTNCLGALKLMAETFETEFDISGKTISLNKVEYNKTSPLALSYGRGNGFKPGLGRKNFDDSLPVEILYVQGGTRNIAYSQYGSRFLLLPKNKTIVYNGRSYKTDAQGRYVYRSDKALSSMVEDSYDGSDIYPSREGTVSSVVEVDIERNFYDIYDTSIPEELNFNDLNIAGETMTLVFQTGALAGTEFNIIYNHGERHIEIAPVEEDGYVLPNESLKPAIGDKYAIFGIMLPSAYISDDVSETGASWDMLRDAVRYLYEHEDPLFSFTGELDGIWAKANWLNVGGKLIPGGYIQFTDTQFQSSGVLVRIKGIKDFVNDPYRPLMELSNIAGNTGVSGELGKIDANELLAEELNKATLRFTKRRFRDAQETLELLGGALLNFSKAINPITVQTMALLVGDESLQYRFVDDDTTPEVVVHDVIYDIETKILNAPAGWIQHMTLGINTISPQHDVSDYSFWNVSEFNSPPLVEADTAYYLYIKASKLNNTAEFILSETAIKIEDVTDYYHFLYGILNSEYDGERSFVTLHGFTEVLPGRITTNKIISPSGKTYIDLEIGDGIGEIGGVIKFINPTGDLQDINDLTYTDVGADPEGAASSAQSSAESFATNLANQLDTLKQNAIVGGQTLISGGYINTNLIQTGALYINSSNVVGLGDLALLDFLNYNDVGADPSGAASTAQDNAEDYADSIYNTLNSAKQNAVVSGKTLIVGGYLNTDFLEVGSIQASKIVTSEITSLGAVTAGTFSLGSGNFIVDASGHLTAIGATIKSSSSGQRIEISNDELRFYNSSGAEKLKIGNIGVDYGIFLTGGSISGDYNSDISVSNSSGIVKSGLNRYGAYGSHFAFETQSGDIHPNYSIYVRVSDGRLVYKQGNGVERTIDGQ